MKVKCITVENDLVLNQTYFVVIIHHNGYELFGDVNRYDPINFEIIEPEEPSEDEFFQVYGMTKDEYLEIYGELPE
jgi:hypothetical protein